MSTLKTIPFKNASGESLTLDSIPAKAYLIVNVASKCGLTPQYEGLQKLNEKFKDKGLTIIGFPANEFLAQEPGTDQEIQDFCSLTYNVSFPVMAKTVVKGEAIHPFFSALTQAKSNYVKNAEPKFEALLKEKGLLTGSEQDIKWNFEKFLVDENGTVIARFFPDIDPNDSRIVSEIENLIA